MGPSPANAVNANATVTTAEAVGSSRGVSWMGLAAERGTSEAG